MRKSVFADPCIACLSMLLCLLTGLHAGHGEAFSSTSQLKALVSQQGKILAAVEDLLVREEIRLTEIRQLLDKIRIGSIVNETQRNREANDRDILNYVGHPVNAYHVIKQWGELQSQITETAKQNILRLEGDLEVLHISLPDDSDLQGALDALVRLQVTYELQTGELADGHVYGHSAARALTPEDSLLVAEAAAAAGSHGFAVQWMDEAMKSKNLTTLSTKTWLLSIESHKEMQFYEEGLDIARTAEKYHPFDDTLTSVRIETERFANATRERQKSQTEPSKPFETPTAWRKQRANWEENYLKLCRDDTPPREEAVTKRLYCGYKAGVLPYVRYKEEVLHLKPRISQFYQVISDSEIAFLKDLAFPDLARALVDGDPTKARVTPSRVSKLSWLWDSNNRDTEELSKRVGYITGLDTSFNHRHSHAEPFQVVNYGMAGQYEPHHDYFNGTEVPPDFLQDSGDRMATFMFYLNDVTAGGATVFPEINLRVTPVKGGAAFWYNLDRSGQPNSDTQHAGCPVLLGEKWVANKWVREYEQERRRSCGLTVDALDFHLWM